jgi:lipid A oxidase
VQSIKLVVTALTIGACSVALAESEFGIYGGLQGSPHSTVENTSTKSNPGSLFTGWKGESFSFPIYIGMRYTHWLDDQWGYSLNYVHTKAISTDQAKNGYTRLEFTDGANPVTVLAMRRFTYREVKPYVGAGLGISVPHVEVQWSGSTKTFEYQYGGPVATVVAGFSYPYNDKWSVFTDFQMHYMKINAAIDSGRLKTNLITNALNVGVSYRF